jgi:GT2 family glycosyltransferase
MTAWRALMWAVDELADATAVPEQGSWAEPRQGSWAEPRQGPWAEPRQGPWAEPRQGSWAEPRQGSWAEPRQGPWAEPRQGPWAEPRQGPSAVPGPADGWRTDASQDHERYRAWLQGRPGGAPGSAGGAGGPIFSVLVPVYRTKGWILERCVESVRTQTWTGWECCICDDGSDDPALTRYLRWVAARDRRIRVTSLPENRGISAATNAAAALATGDLVALLDHDDELTPGALAAVAEALVARPEADVVYTDEDKLDPDGQPFGPRFKPDFSPDYLLTTPYMGHLLVVRRSLFTKLGGMRSKMDGSQDYDLMLRATEAARSVLHVPELAYHWRVVPGSAAGDATAKPWAYAASGRALTSALRRRGEDAELEAGPMPGMWNARRRLPDGISISVVVSALGDAVQLRACVDGLGAVEPLPSTTGAGMAEVLVSSSASGVAEVLVSSSGSGVAEVLVSSSSPGVAEVGVAAPDRPDLETRALLGALAERPGVRVFAGPSPVAAANAAARGGAGTLVLFVDSRIVPAMGAWMAAMAEHAMRDGVGPVGARLVSPAGLVRHVGLVLGLRGRPAAPVLEGLGAAEYGYLEAARITRNWSAVSSACLMIRRELFDELGGFDEAMGPWADVDLCLRAAQLGQRSLLCSLAELMADLPPSGVGGGVEAERARFLERWGDLVRAGDPFFSPHLSRLWPECVIADEDEEELWNNLMWPPAR